MPACAIASQRKLSMLLDAATLTAALSIEAMAAAKDCYDPALKAVSSAPGIATVLDALQRYLKGSRIRPVKLQPPVSVRIVAQVVEQLIRLLQDGGLTDLTSA